MIKDNSIFTHLYQQGDTPSDYIRSGKFYEEDIFLRFKSQIPESGTILDVGANIGNHSVMFAQYYPGRSVFSFEANPITYSLLINNTRTIPNVVPICCAVSDQVELIQFVHFHPSPGCSRIIKYYGDVEGESVMCGTNIDECVKVNIVTQVLDSFSFEDVSFIKIDVEGHEIPVFEGARNLIASQKPAIWIEDFKYEENPDNRSGVQYLIQEFNYRVVDKDIDCNYLLKYSE